MKIGNIVQPNQKGQVVIPKDIRDALGITEHVPLNMTVNGNTIFMYPITGITSASQSDQSSCLAVLKKTQGSWKGEDWIVLQKKRRAFELSASKKRKQSW